MWENFVPPLVRRSDRSAQKLEFYLQIYFSIFPLHPANRSGVQPAAIHKYADASPSPSPSPSPYPSPSP